MYKKRIFLISLLLSACSEHCDTRPSNTKATDAAVSKAQLTKKIAPPESPEQSKIHVAQQTQKQTYTLKQGSTITHLLKKAGFSISGIYQLAHVVKDDFNFKKSQIGAQFDVITASNKRTVVFATSYGTLIEATLKDKQWRLNKVNVPLSKQRFSESFEINHSLYQAAYNADIPVNVTNSAVLAMSHFVDFQREIRKGDHLTLNFTQSNVLRDAHLFAHLNAPQQLVAIEFTNKKKHYQLYQYDNVFYFNSGKLAQNFLMKTPLNGARLSSYFGKRKHPVLGYTRQHKGIDFSAPIGTPIMAAGKGRIVKANYSRSFGNRILIDHGNGYRTLYAHLKGFAKGIKKGAQVTQGQTIGYLGNTGLSSARHLHYEIHKHGRAINPLNMKQPSNVQLKGNDLIAFQAHIQFIDQTYATLINKPTLLNE